MKNKSRTTKIGKKLFITSLSFFLFFFFFFLFSPRVKASDFSLGIYPPIIQIQANAPTIIDKDITLVNASEEEQTVSVIFRQFISSPYSNGQVSYLPASAVTKPDTQLFQKIQIQDSGNPTRLLTLAPKQKKQVTLHIELPRDEPPGDYYFSVLFQSLQTTQNQTGSAIAAAIATNVLLSIGPKGQTTGFLDEFSAPWFAQAGPVPFTVSVSNTSSHFISPTGHILVRNMFGQIIGKVDLLPVNVLANSSRFIPSKEGLNKSPHPVALWNEKFLFGPYRANIVIALSDEGPIYTRTIYFFAMPWEYIVGGFLALGIVGIIIARVKHRAKTL